MASDMNREDLMNMSTDDLKDMAKKKNMQNVDNMSKNDLIDALMRQ